MLKNRTTARCTIGLCTIGLCTIGLLVPIGCNSGVANSGVANSGGTNSGGTNSGATPPASAPQPPPTQQYTPTQYAQRLGRGMDVDWAKTAQGIKAYHAGAPADFKQRGFSHVRIRIKNEADEALLTHLDGILSDCLEAGLIPIVAYQGAGFKENPTQQEMDKVVAWWRTVSSRYRNQPAEVSFDIIIEVTAKLNKEPAKLNQLYENAVAAIRETNPERIVFISPRVRSSPEHLVDLVIPSRHNNHLMAEWHFYAAGPSRSNPKKQWTTGSEAEKDLIRAKVKLAKQWQASTSIPTWVGAWMPSNYNDTNDYSIDEQVAFATFVSCELANALIPFAVNSDTKFYDRDNHQWLPAMAPVVDAILHACAPH